MKKYSFDIMRNFRVCGMALFGAFMALMMASCGSAPDAESMLETIPADAYFVARLDADLILDNAGIVKSDNKYELSDDIDKLLEKLPSDARDNVDDVLKALPAFDLKNIFVYMYDTEKVVITCGLEHPKEVKIGLEKELGKASDEEGFDVFDDEGIVVAIKGNQLWGAKKLKHITKAIELAEKNNFAAYGGVSTEILGEHALAFVLNNASIYDLLISMQGKSVEQQLKPFEQFKDAFSCINFNLSGATASLTFKMIDKDGKSVAPAKAFDNIDTSFMKYVPGNVLGAVALGAPTSELLDKINENANYRNQEFGKFIDGINGTMAFAIAPPASINGIADIENWTMTAMVHYPEYISSDLMNMLLNQFNDGYYTSVISEGDQFHVSSLYRSVFDSHNFYFGAFDGYFIISNKRIAAVSPNNTFASKLEGEQFAAYAALEKDNAIVKPLGLPFGAELSAKSDSSNGSISFTLTGTDKKLLEAFIALAADQKLQRNIINAMESYTRQAYSNDYDSYGTDSIAVTEIAIVEDSPYEEVAAEEYYY